MFSDLSAVDCSERTHSSNRSLGPPHLVSRKISCLLPTIDHFCWTPQPGSLPQPSLHCAWPRERLSVGSCTSHIWPEGRYIRRKPKWPRSVAPVFWWWLLACQDNRFRPVRRPSLCSPRACSGRPPPFSPGWGHHLGLPRVRHWCGQHSSIDTVGLGFLNRQHCRVLCLLIVHQAIVNLTLFSYIQLGWTEYFTHVVMGRASDRFCWMTHVDLHTIHKSRLSRYICCVDVLHCHTSRTFDRSYIGMPCVQSVDNYSTALGVLFVRKLSCSRTLRPHESTLRAEGALPRCPRWCIPP